MKQGDLAAQGIMRQEDGYYIIRQSMPYPLGDNNAYLVEGNSGWVVLDVGIDLPATREVWEMVFRETGISASDIQAIYITHCHPDHLGAARWLQEKCDAPIFMSQEEIDRAHRFIFLAGDYESAYHGAIIDQVEASDFPLDLCAALVKDWHLEVSPRFPEPAEILPVHPGNSLQLQGSRFTIIQAPIHADGQFMLWSPDCHHLFCADVMVAGAYLHFTDWPNSFLTNPLDNFFTLVDNLQSLGEIKAFPGHGLAINDMSARLGRLRKRHQLFLGRMGSAVKEPMTAGQVYRQLVETFGFRFEDIDYIHLHRVLMGETLGYLEYLVSQNQMEKWLDHGKYYYAPVK